MIHYVFVVLSILNILTIVGTVAILFITVRDLTDVPNYDVKYICDRKACAPDRCGYKCKYTSDITHAVNFQKAWYGYCEEEK